VTAVFDEGIREMQFTLAVPFQTLLQTHGRLPLPPYIKIDDAHAQERYQTIFAEVPGSVAAPTASLHFTSEVFARLDAGGIQRAYVNLDVGIGTFRPMTSERIDDHTMHAEAYDIPQATVAAIRRAKEEGRRIVAGGTTVVRTLEGSVAQNGCLSAGQGQTNLFISPGFRFQIVDAMITNFHLPRSTLLVLVSAFAGRERILDAYREAVAAEYRFFSFGDAMLLEKEASA
ncbi:MAG: tRNA preQ1(34) S-adenosylmethionine ribosyltransferase-isomerase QueA, partial [Vulcanimicrobiaceae bacterium]